LRFVNVGPLDDLQHLTFRNCSDHAVRAVEHLDSMPDLSCGREHLYGWASHPPIRGGLMEHIRCRSLPKLELGLQDGTDMSVERNQVLLVGVTMPEVIIQSRHNKGAQCI